MPSDDDLIDAAPCPKCKAPLAVSAADLGYLIECPSCGTQSRAKRAEAPPPAADAPPPRRRNWDGDRDEERRPSRSRDRGRDDEREESDGRPARERDTGDEYADRRRGRARHRDDDDYDLPPPRRPGQGAAVAAAVMNFVFAALALIEGLCVGIGGVSLVAQGPRGNGGGPFGGPENAGLVFLGFGVCNLVGVGLMIPAGIGLLQRRDYGRVLGFLSAGLGLIYAFGIVIGFLVILAEDGGGRVAAAGYIIPLIGVMLWLAYAITNLILLGKVRRQPTR